MTNIVYTIGYTSFDINKFIEVLKSYNVKCLIDVRSLPKSGYYKDFDDTNLSKLLQKNDIIYRNYQKEFGARQENKEFYNKDGYLDFELFSQSKQFQEGIEKVKNAENSGYTVCLMCAEKDPINCHRTILITHNLYKNNFNIKHILADESTCSQKDIDNRLLEIYFPNRSQISLFETDNLSEEENIEQAYRLKNKEIGFKLEEE